MLHDLGLGTSWIVHLDMKLHLKHPEGCLRAHT